jgi:alpha-N-arabinofuranosidase
MNHIKIDLERTLSDIDHNIFGGYMEIGYRDTEFKYLNVDDSAFSKMGELRSDVRETIRRMKLPNIRFPGGNFASGYRWMDGVGPVEERPSRHDLAWRCTVSNKFGTNEFIKLCRNFNIEPYLNVNCGDGDMREAADWVEYCNGTGNTDLVKLRQKHGFHEPHNVKYWAIGNEVDSPGQIGYKTPQEYAREYTEFSKVMKRVDPNIKLIASAVCSWEDYPLGAEFLYRKTEWVERAQLMLEQAGDRIDYMAIHRYAHPHEDDPFETYMAFAADYNERLNAYEGLIHAISLEKGINHAISIAVDEWGIIRSSPNREIWRHVNLTDAMVTALHLNAFIRHARSIRLANFPRMPTSIGVNLSQPEGKVILQTNFYPFELYSRTCGQLALDVFWCGETFSGLYKNRTFNGIRALDVAATLDNIGKQLVIYVVNQSKEEAQETAISLISGHFTEKIKVSVVNGPDIKAENTTDEPNKVGVKESTFKVSGKSFTYTFEPHSVTALECIVD